MQRLLYPLLFAFLTPVAPAAVHVDPPMIEVQGGMEFSPQTPVNVLLRVSIDGLSLSSDSGAHYMIAKLGGNLAISTSGEGSRVPYSDIEFVPLVIDRPGGLTGGEVRILPTQIMTQVRLDEKVVLRVEAVGLVKEVLAPAKVLAHTFIFGKVAADALGVKILSRISDQGNFYGASVLAVAGEFGAIWRAGKSFKVRVAFGGAVDLNMGSQQNQGFAVQSDFKLYSEISADLLTYLRIFVRNGYNRAANSSLATVDEYQLMVGAGFVF